MKVSRRGINCSAYYKLKIAVHTTSWKELLVVSMVAWSRGEVEENINFWMLACWHFVIPNDKWPIFRGRKNYELIKLPKRIRILFSFQLAKAIASFYEFLMFFLQSCWMKTWFTIFFVTWLWLLEHFISFHI